MFKSYHDTSSADQFKGFPNLNFQGSNSAYGFSGVYFWLDAAFGLNTQTNLGAVSRWQPRIGRSVFEQTTAGSQPRLVLNDANYNNLPSVEAIDNNRVMQSALNGGLAYNVNCTIAVISKLTTATLFNGIIGTNAGTPTGLSDGGNQANFNGFGYSAGSMVLQGTTESANARIKIISDTSVIVNGITESTGTNSKSPAELFQLFRTATSGANYIGSIAEIIAYNFSMTSEQCIQLSNTINQKYALY
jgi:hypothetical protein